MNNFQAAKFCAELRKQEGHQAWIVGIVEQGQRDAKVIDRPRIIEVITGDDGSVQVKTLLCGWFVLIHSVKSGSKNPKALVKNTGSLY